MSFTLRLLKAIRDFYRHQWNNLGYREEELIEELQRVKNEKQQLWDKIKDVEKEIAEEIKD